MPWFRLDEGFHSHPKVMAAGNEAVGLYVRCGTYAAEHLTDGFIPEQVALQYGTRKLAESLVQAKLWRRTRGGWRMPDYLDYNPSAAQVKAERKQAAERQRRHRSNRSVTPHYFSASDPVDNSRSNTVEGQTGTSDEVLSRRDSRRDSRVSHGTPSRFNPGITSGSVGTQSADRNGRARASPQTITAILNEIHDTTGTNVTPAWAQTIAEHILDGRTPDNPTAYVRQAIRSEPNPRLRFLPQYPEHP